MSSKLVENIGGPSETKDKGLLLVTVREGNTLPPVLCRISDDGKVMLGLEQTVQCGFRKIEPKPKSGSTKEDGCEDNHSGGTRLLESKSTRRGVRICPTCQGRVGYRSKVCKHCFKSSGFSNKSTSNVKRRQSGQKGSKSKPKKGAKMVPNSGFVQRNSEECHTIVSIDNIKAQRADLKPADTLLYVPKATSTLETISDLDLQFSTVANKAMPIENVCQMPASNEGNETRFDAEQAEIIDEQKIDYLEELKNSDHELSQNPDHENISQEFTSCGNDSVSTLSNMTVGSSYEEISQNVALEGENLASHVVKVASDFSPNDVVTEICDVENRGTSADNLCIDIHHQINSEKTSADNGEHLSTEGEKCNSSTDDKENQSEVSVDDTSDEMNAEDPRLTQADSSENTSSPMILVDVNSISSISVATTDNQSRSADLNAVSTLENTFVFENTNTNLSTAISNNENSVDILAEIKARSEERENVKRKKKPKVWQELQSRRKKPKVPSVQFVRIEPKAFVEVSDDSKKIKPGNTKQNRLLASNPTRRGIMLCPLCRKDVGCRSRTCKYCKVAINLYPTRQPLDQKNLLAVQLCEETCSEYTIFSVKKTFNASEDRCFIRKGKINVKEGLPKNDKMSEFFFCDCIDNNPVGKHSCEHIVCMYKGPKVIHARNVALKPSRIGALPVDLLFKLKLNELWEKVKEKEFPLVQQVCQNTLVVVDVDQNIETTPSSCVHIRFEKIKRRSNPELHIFCSGMTCSAWNEVKDGDEDGPLTCMHYCVSLWAIASDNDLQKYLKIFLDATQVYLHSEVFDNVLRE